MPHFTEHDIASLNFYTTQVKMAAETFYDERFQPNARTKEKIERENFRFWELEYGIPTTGIRFLTKEENISQALLDHDYEAIMPYKMGGTAATFILKDKVGDWSLMRIWTKDNDDAEQGRLYHPLVLQPLKIIPLENTYPIEILPLCPIIDIEMKRRSKQSPNDLDAGIFVESVLKTEFNKANLNYMALNDLAVLPNGQIVFADPGHCAARTSVLSPVQLQEQFADFKKATEDFPFISNLFDYVDLETKQWSQDAFFPKAESLKL